MPSASRARVEPLKAAGERMLLVVIEEAATIRGPSGTPVLTWVSLLPNEFMARTHVESDERWAAGQTSAWRVFSWQMRYRRDMDPDLVNVSRDRRLVYKGKVYDIRSATIVGENVAISIATLSRG